MTSGLLYFGYSFRIMVLEQLFVEPDVFPAIAVGDAGGHDRQPFDVGPPAGPAAAVKDDRPGAILD
jgi:hypothetical protein